MCSHEGLRLPQIPFPMVSEGLLRSLILKITPQINHPLRFPPHVRAIFPKKNPEVPFRIFPFKDPLHSNYAPALEERRLTTRQTSSAPHEQQTAQYYRVTSAQPASPPRRGFTENFDYSFGLGITSSAIWSSKVRASARALRYLMKSIVLWPVIFWVLNALNPRKASAFMFAPSQ
jgi:hypothetical protein